MRLQESTLEKLLADIGRTSPRISGSTAALVAAQLGAAMAKMGLLVSENHGFDNEEAVEQLDSIVTDIKAATERDRAASTALIDAYRRSSDESNLQRARAQATREPLAAGNLLIELLALLEKNSARVDPSVASDFHGGVEMIGASFKAVMMSVETNLKDDLTTDLRNRTSSDWANLLARYETAREALRRSANAHGLTP
ncbi:cyclodeaminase/cyclohydrolase family protein [Rhizobium leguminosarum]|uniref:cyclodeaminase/cyclohydrolase family protein n=1 Tax=Rhizobium leguminosarum TaxID=384 RepID=UPI0015FBA6C7|nr:cyclodeaminase/cyclohydrolase family protein [Rhizobium leguminosarum]MBA9035963.1 formiminotetrahydrofolate cyclodeaminase [Rhizobium leguminosarum]